MTGNNIYEEQQHVVCRKSSSSLLSTDSGSPGPAESLLPTRLPSAHTDNTAGFTRNVPSPPEVSAPHLKPLKREWENGNVLTKADDSSLLVIHNSSGLGIF